MLEGSLLWPPISTACLNPNPQSAETFKDMVIFILSISQFEITAWRDLRVIIMAAASTNAIYAVSVHSCQDTSHFSQGDISNTLFSTLDKRAYP